VAVLRFILAFGEKYLFKLKKEEKILANLKKISFKT